MHSTLISICAHWLSHDTEYVRVIYQCASKGLLWLQAIVFICDLLFTAQVLIPLASNLHDNKGALFVTLVCSCVMIEYLSLEAFLKSAKQYFHYLYQQCFPFHVISLATINEKCCEWIEGNFRT